MQQRNIAFRKMHENSSETFRVFSFQNVMTLLMSALLPD